MKTTYAALFALACALISSSLEFRWLEQEGRITKPAARNVQSVRPTVAEPRAAANDSAAAGLSIPCQWVSITGANEPLNPRCVNADLTERK